MVCCVLLQGERREGGRKRRNERSESHPIAEVISSFLPLFSVGVTPRMGMAEIREENIIPEITV
jgi:hypothetical protein